MSYILKGSSEAKRLVAQSELPLFSLKQELQGLQIDKGARILDAGCGAGVLCGHLDKKYEDIFIEGCDVDVQSLAYAKEHFSSARTHFFVHDFVRDTLTKQYDIIFNRLVAHHLTEESLLRGYLNIFCALKPSGKIYVIDPDGMMLNLGTRNKELLRMMKLVSSGFGGDLVIARKVPGILNEVGFSDISWRIEVMDFQGKDRENEILQWKERFISGLEFYLDLFGSQDKAQKFFDLYLLEASRQSVPMFYNKFIIKAEKP